MSLFKKLYWAFSEWLEDRRYRSPYPPGPPYEGNMEFTGPDYGIGEVVDPTEHQALLEELYYLIEPDSLSDDYHDRVRAKIGLPAIDRTPKPPGPPDIGPRDSVQFGVTYEQQLANDKYWHERMRP